MGIAAEINAKNRFPPAGGLSGTFLPTGEVELAIQQIPELKQVAGIEIVGPLPAPYELVTVFVAGDRESEREGERGQDAVDFLRTPPRPRSSARRASIRPNRLAEDRARR